MASCILKSSYHFQASSRLDFLPGDRSDSEEGDGEAGPVDSSATGRALPSSQVLAKTFRKTSSNRFFCDGFAIHWPRRSYNYRVVMVCGDAELDMRCLSEPVSNQDVVSERHSCRFWCFFIVFRILQPLPNAKDQTSVGKCECG